MTRRLRNDRVGGARNDDRQAGKGTASPLLRVRPRRVTMSCDDEDGCGNAVPVESNKHFPQGLGNLAL